MHLSTRVHHAGWHRPLVAAHGGAEQPRPLVLVQLEAPDGVVGYGEAAPLESYDGVSVAMVLAALEAYSPLLAAAGTIEPGGHSAVLEACRRRVDLPQALAAVDLALWDLAGRRAERPVWWLLGGEAAPEVTINAVIGAEDPAASAGAASVAIRRGYGTVKVKVGAGDDLARLRAIRTVIGPLLPIRIDANGQWGSVEAAVDALSAFAELGIELCEEPVHGAAGIAAVADAASIPIVVDESVSAEVLDSRMADGVCLKIAAAGGISGVLDAAVRARQAGYELVYLASTLDGPLGIAAALHAAAALAPDRACGLSTLDRFAVAPPFSVSGGRLSPPEGPGLGDGLLDWYAQLED